LLNIKNMKVINGNNIDILKQYPDNYFDAIVTDPPYGLGKEPNATELMKDWIEKGYHEITGTGFMGKEWDAFIPQPIFWKEVFRVLKHGGHVLSFFGTRTYDWGVMSMRFAGFEVRDCIQWLYGSGFPKSHNISKAIDKMYGAEREVVGKKECGYQVSISKKRVEEGYRPNLTNSTKEVDITAPKTNEAKQWDGWGSALKPANEPIVLARKPLEKGLTIAENVLKWGTGAINIDGCRVEFTDIVNMGATQTTNNLSKVKFFDDDRNNLEKPIETYKSGGRFPANLILTHHEDCECIENENWNCVDDCPIKILDEQSGVLKSGAMNSIAKGGKYNVYGTMTERIVTNEASEGGASRFFYVAKASKSERNKGLDGFKIYKQEELSSQEKTLTRVRENGTIGENPYLGKTAEAKNIHPTVKPIKLMQYLIRLITPPNGIVLDPFCGSGTTGVACKLEGFQFIGLEQDEEYSKIAQARIDNYVEENTPQKSVKTIIINKSQTSLNLY
jgi:site-specific DNA-methyltransferase (adenine-specific)